MEWWVLLPWKCIFHIGRYKDGIFFYGMGNTRKGFPEEMEVRFGETVVLEFFSTVLQPDTKEMILSVVSFPLPKKCVTERELGRETYQPMFYLLLWAAQDEVQITIENIKRFYSSNIYSVPIRNQMKSGREFGQVHKLHYQPMLQPPAFLTWYSVPHDIGTSPRQKYLEAHHCLRWISPAACLTSPLECLKSTFNTTCWKLSSHTFALNLVLLQFLAHDWRHSLCSCADGPQGAIAVMALPALPPTSASRSCCWTFVFLKCMLFSSSLPPSPRSNYHQH